MMDIEKITKLGYEMGINPMDKNFQEAISLSEHCDKCKYCAMIFDNAREIVNLHIKESET